MYFLLNICLKRFKYPLCFLTFVNMKLDETDKAILNSLVQNSRQSYRQLAKKIGVSVATIMTRVKRLEEEKIIKEYTTRIDYEKLGYDLRVLIDIRISKGQLFQIEKKIAKDPNVSTIFDNTGPFDATIIAIFKNRRTMDAFLKKIQSYEFVERTETKLVLSTIKDDFIKL